ncbi:hypothetical protein AgCh_019355 [Apium graveolens]
MIVRLRIYFRPLSFKFFKGLAYMHMDLKPQNVLVDPLTHKVKICDLGSAKVLSEIVTQIPAPRRILGALKLLAHNHMMPSP